MFPTVPSCLTHNCLFTDPSLSLRPSQDMYAYMYASIETAGMAVKQKDARIKHL